jgi:hypothetical protein
MCTAELAAGLQELGSAARLLQDGARTCFLPAYGCALLIVDAAEQAAALQPDELQLHLLCLDGWEFGVHRWGEWLEGVRAQCGSGIARCGWLAAGASSHPVQASMPPSLLSSPPSMHAPRSRNQTPNAFLCCSSLHGYAHTAAASGQKLLPAGSVPAGRRGELVQAWHAAIAVAKARQNHGQKGHQHTPAFARAALDAARERVLRSVTTGDGDGSDPTAGWEGQQIIARGGTTDGALGGGLFSEPGGATGAPCFFVHGFCCLAGLPPAVTLIDSPQVKTLHAALRGPTQWAPTPALRLATPAGSWRGSP